MSEALSRKRARFAQCSWCGNSYTAKGRGSRQRFCRATCRAHFHTAARRWTEREITAGRLQIEDLRRDES